jgi:hypothetical protein
MVWAMYAASLGCVVVLLCGGVRVDPAVEVLEVALAAGMSEREPDRPFLPPGPCREWDWVQTPRIDPTRHPSIVIWTRIKSATPLELVHTYYRASLDSEKQEMGWQEVAAVTLPIGRSSSWRTWSEKTLTQDTDRMLEGTWKVDITIAALPDTVLCTVHFFVLTDAVWQALTEEPHVQDMLCRMATTPSPSSLFRAGQEVLKSRTDGGEDSTTTVNLLSGWERFVQHATASDRLFCTGDE